ncbi:hypothetical protein QLL95_gp0356 [Cotonvirus japonicus]|uniref:Replication origin-binding protein domain-containing protein n=1 Tax=Cotonvirus japonicus TaxID=2811091 RepID=A0ABM7NUL6_9VIRU|nr:hypothetical protein QLL95_gp0356 [Cotonvirus japonicus]BCS83767.1 hypothetical protein [Cotonvirus japonicus]
MHISYYRNDLKKHLIENNLSPKIHLSIQHSPTSYRFSYAEEFTNFFKKIKKLEVNGKYYLHELFLAGQKRKPYLDLEHVYPDEKTFKSDYKQIIVKLQKDIIQIFKSEYHEDITIDDILILDSSGKVDNGFKMSYHIVIAPSDRTFYYTDSKCSTSSTYHLFAQLINLDSNYQLYLDKNVYNSEPTLRMIGSYKINSDRVLKPIDNKTFKPIEIFVEEKYNYLISYIKNPSIKLNTPIIEQTTHKIETITLNSPTKTNIPEQIEGYVDKFHPKARYYGFVKYGENNILVHSFNYKNRQEICPISGTTHKTNGFYVLETSKGYFMKCHSTKCKDKKAKYLGPVDASDSFVKCAHQIDQQYLIMEKGIGDNPNEPVKDFIKNWLSNDDIKTLAVRSPMGTGKTTMIKKIFDYDDTIKKVLWISHRQTLSKQILGSFKKYNFVNYMDVDGNLFQHDRLIVQIDSLKRIFKFDESGNIMFKQYDLIVIDEIEGNMNHYMSPYLKNDHCYSVREIFEKMTGCVETAKKLLVLDADLSVRTKMFIDNFGKSTVINNNFKLFQKTFEITNDLCNFEKELLDDLRKKKNICVVSMSASYLARLEPFISKYQYVIHTSKSDDKLKDELEDVNNFWTNYQVCCFSPTIECGVDFNKKHFDKIYCYLKCGSKTCSQRSFLQMVGRIRQINDPHILCYYEGTTNIDADIYTFDDILSYFKHYESINKRKILENVEYKKEISDGIVTLKRVNADISLFDYIRIYNEVEESNKNHFMFMTVLCKLIQKAGHVIEFNIVEQPPKPNKNECMKHGKVLSLIDETKHNIKELLKKQSKNQLTSHDKLVLEKYFFIKRFGITDTSNEKQFAKFHKKYAGKEIIFSHFERFFRYAKKFKSKSNSTDLKDLDEFITDYFDLDDKKSNKSNDLLEEHSDAKNRTRDNIVLNFLNIILDKTKSNFNPDDLDYVFTFDEHEEGILTIANYSIYFKDEMKNRALFSKSKGKLKNISEHNFDSYLKSVQHILNLYGIKYLRGNRVQINGVRKYNYSLSVDRQIKDIVDFKYKLSNTVDEFPNLFH